MPLTPINHAFESFDTWIHHLRGFVSRVHCWLENGSLLYAYAINSFTSCGTTSEPESWRQSCSPLKILSTDDNRMRPSAENWLTSGCCPSTRAWSGKINCRPSWCQYTAHTTLISVSLRRYETHMGGDSMQGEKHSVKTPLSFGWTSDCRLKWLKLNTVRHQEMDLQAPVQVGRQCKPTHRKHLRSLCSDPQVSEGH